MSKIAIALATVLAIGTASVGLIGSASAAPRGTYLAPDFGPSYYGEQNTFDRQSRPYDGGGGR